MHAVVHVPQCASVEVRSWHPSPQQLLPVAQLMPQLWQWRVSMGTHASLQQSTWLAPSASAVGQSRHAPPQ